MSKDVQFLVTLYCVMAVLGGGVLAAAFATEKPKFLRPLGTEGRAVAGVLVGILWLLVALALLVRYAPRAAVAIGRGFAQLFRFVRPKKPDMPEARTVRR